jgi:hypothetical protein
MIISLTAAQPRSDKAKSPRLKKEGSTSSTKKEGGTTAASG